MNKGLTTINGADYKVSFSEKGYQDLNDQLRNDYSYIFLLVDTNTQKHCLPYFLEKIKILEGKSVITIKAGEVYKNLESCQEVWQELSDLGADRKSLLINLGGGVVTDLGGFVAASFKRGIDFVNIPTTLLSMVDASVGGKTGVDLGGLKNQIGIITNPKLVVVDAIYLQTLPKKEYRSGYAEMLKHGIIRHAEYFKSLSKFQYLEEKDIIHHIHHSISIKNEVVTADPFENNLRKILNFGHTLGHAIESYFLTNSDKKSLLHGEAIAVGIITEAYLAFRLAGLSIEAAEEIKAVFLNIFSRVHFTRQDINDIIALLKYDKKNSHGKVKFVLLKAIAQPVIDMEITEENLRAAFKFYQAS